MVTRPQWPRPTGLRAHGAHETAVLAWLGHTRYRGERGEGWLGRLGQAPAMESGCHTERK
jgi:hypothetical protein